MINDKDKLIKLRNHCAKTLYENKVFTQEYYNAFVKGFNYAAQIILHLNLPYDLKGTNLKLVVNSREKDSNELT